MEWLAEFGGWFGLVALAFGGPALVQHHFSQSGVSRRRILRSERRVRKLKDITERFERMQAMQRSIEARQAALDTPDQEHLGTLRELCMDLAVRAAAERRAPGSTTLAQDIEVLLDAAASLGNEYTRSASLGHILEVCVQAGLYEQARSHARWVTDASVRDRLFQNPSLAPLLRPDGPVPLLLWPPVRDPVPVDPRPPARDAAD